MPAISIICPVYNVASLLKRCVDGIILQTFTDWELILIDDGSTDISGSICDQYATLDHRIKVFHKKNEGVSSARQTGSDRASGEYIIHVDPDDYVESSMLECLYNKAITTNADVVICDFYVDELNGKIRLVHQNLASTRSESVLRSLLLRRIHGSCWNKLVRKSCYVKYEVHFPSKINYCEDQLFWVQLLKHEDIKIVYDPHAYYHYVMNVASITHNYTYKTFEVRIRYIKKLEEILPQNYERELRSVRLDVFFEAFMHGILEKNEARKMLWENRIAAFLECKSFRYRAGYCALLLGLFPLARRLLRY